MEVYFRSVIGFFILLLFPNFVTAQAPPVLEQMSVEEKVGHLFIVGFPQQRLDSQLEAFIKKNKVSSFILFKRNISSLSQVAKMNADLYKLALSITKTTPFIAVDQEGGHVARVPTRPPIPNAMSIGQTQDPVLAHELGGETAKIIRTLGFNMNLAPVLDISSPDSESFIGMRSFGSDAEKVSSIGVSLSRGLLDQAVIPTAKHFPGVGAISEDPHKKVVEYTAAAETFYDRDLKPFEDYAKLGPNTAIMLSHFSYPTLDETKTPATISPKIIKEILRKKLGYEGLVITDDIQMKGLSEISNPHEAGLQALKAGADIIMMTWSFKDQARAIQRVREAVASGELPLAEVDAKVARILAVKNFLKEKTPATDALRNSRAVALSTKKLREIEARILDFNIKVALDVPSDEGAREPATIQEPPKEEKAPICLFSPANEFIESFKKSNVSLITTKTTPRTKSELLVATMHKNRCAFGVYAIYGKKTAAILENIPSSLAKKFLVVNLNSPSLIPEPGKFLNVVNLYFPHPDAGRKIGENLRGLARRNNSNEVAKTDSAK